jgi:hypothetical protein
VTILWVKTSIIIIIIIVARKNGLTKFSFHPSLLLLFLDPGWVKFRIRDPG